jgi:hypothetical protein
VAFVVLVGCVYLLWHQFIRYRLTRTLIYPFLSWQALSRVYEELYTYTTCVRALDLLNCRALSRLHVYSLRPPRLAVAARLQGRQRAGRRPRCVLPARRAHHGVRAVVLVASAAVLRVVSMIRFGLVTHR